VRQGEPLGAGVGEWEAIERLDDDGLAVAWLARRRGTQKFGVLERWSITRPEDSGGLKREMFAIERLEHPSFARVLASGVDEGRPWRVIEWLTGPPLRTWVRDRWPAPPRQQDAALRSLLSAFASLCVPLAWLAGEGEPHGDLDPSHLVVRGEHELVITRFDFAARAERESDRFTPPSAGERANFRAPERLRGEPVDTRADLYALGAMLYWALTGRPPYATVEEATVGGATPPAPSVASPGLPRDLDGLVQSLIVRSPRGRPSDARAVCAELVRLGATEPHTVLPPRARLLPPAADGPGADERLDALGVAMWMAPVLGRVAVPAAFARVVHRATEGQVFAVAEWLRAAVALGVLQLDETGAWRLDGHGGLPDDDAAWARVAMPSGAREVTHRRLKTLSSSARALVQDAALLGDAFDDAVWFAIGERPVEDAERIARELRRREVILRAGPGRSAFAHPIVHEVVAQLLPPRRRREMHERVAQAMEQHTPAAAVTIAEHWSAARSYDRAALWFRRAAETADAAGDLASAEALRQRARTGK